MSFLGSNRRRPSVSKGAKTRRQRREEELSPTVETVPSKEATPNVEEDQAPSPAVEPTGPRRQSKSTCGLSVFPLLILNRQTESFRRRH